ncbi:MAG: FMN-binding protein [Lachnospiraceae bacterium]
MDKKKNGTVMGLIMKDAAILCAITLIAGTLLASVNEMTKKTIERRKLEESLATYEVAYTEAADFAYSDSLTSIVKEADKLLNESGNDFGKMTINEALEAKDESGSTIGYMIAATSGDGYAGDIKVAVGVSMEGTITGVEILESGETAGLGSKASDDSFKSQYKDKQVDSFVVVKGNASADNEIDSISGATFTSKAVTNAVNAAVYFVNNCIEK